jgi:hypothetical protein
MSHFLILTFFSNQIHIFEVFLGENYIHVLHILCTTLCGINFYIYSNLLIIKDKTKHVTLLF